MTGPQIIVNAKTKAYGDTQWLPDATAIEIVNDIQNVWAEIIQAVAISDTDKMLLVIREDLAPALDIALQTGKESVTVRKSIERRFVNLKIEVDDTVWPFRLYVYDANDEIIADAYLIHAAPGPFILGRSFIDGGDFMIDENQV